MLGKLFKYEWKSVSLLLAIMHVGLLIYTLVGRIGYQFFLHDYTGGPTEGLLGMGIIFYVLVYAIGIMVVVFMTVLYLAMRIQKSLFSDEGYLTNTLPVTPSQLLLSKAFIYWVWVIIDALVMIASGLILIVNKETWPVITRTFSEMWGSLISVTGFSEVMNNIVYLLSLAIDFFCYHTGMLLFAICLGSLFKTHKIMGAVVSFFGLNIVSNIIMLFISGLVRTGPVTSLFITTSYGRTHSSIYLFSTAWYLIAGIAFFFGSKYILTKKLNLE